jgi:hypothetical protein
MARRTALAALALVLILVYGTAQLHRAVPVLTARLVLPAAGTVPGPDLQLPTPTGAETMVAVPGVGVLASSGGDAEVPIASVTKLMSAFVVLAGHPLRAGGPGRRSRCPAPTSLITKPKRLRATLLSLSARVRS